MTYKHLITLIESKLNLRAFQVCLAAFAIKTYEMETISLSSINAYKFEKLTSDFLSISCFIYTLIVFQNFSFLNLKNYPLRY